MEMNVGGRFRAPLASACLPRRHLAKALQSPALQAIPFPVFDWCVVESQRQEIKVRNRVSLDRQGQEIQVAHSSEVTKY